MYKENLSEIINTIKDARNNQLPTATIFSINNENPNFNNFDDTQYRYEYQLSIDSVLNDGLDFVSNNMLFDKLKNYESKFGISSKNFYNKWKLGETPTNPEIHDWMSIYQGFAK